MKVSDPDSEPKNLIDRAYREGEPLGLAVWTQDEAGPYPTRPMPGQSWAEQGQAQRQPHECVRNGTAKLLTLFCPHNGELRAKGALALHPMRYCIHAVQSAAHSTKKIELFSEKFTLNT